MTTTISRFRREFVRKFRQVGLTGTAKHVAGKLAHAALHRVAERRGKEVDAFDMHYGTDTSGIIGVGALDIPDDKIEHAMRYVPISEDEFVNSLTSLPVVCEEMLFIDLGSGKGRALLLASLFPFRKIIGIELSRMLHDIALRNVAHFKTNRQKCSDVQIVLGDASSFDIPDEPILFFVNNPFDDHVLRLVALHIGQSFKRHQRQIYIWYIKPCYRQVLDGLEFLKAIKDTGRYVVYQAVAT